MPLFPIWDFVTYCDFSFLKGRKDDLMKIRLKENYGDFIGSDSSFTYFKGKEVVDRLGHGSRDSSFFFEKTKDYCGSVTENCFFKVKETGEDIGVGSRDSVFIVNKYCYDFNEDYSRSNNRPWDCIFKTPNKMVLEKFLSGIPQGNRIIFMKGKEEEIVRDYAQS